MSCASKALALFILASASSGVAQAPPPPQTLYPTPATPAPPPTEASPPAEAPPSAEALPPSQASLPGERELTDFRFDLQTEIPIPVSDENNSAQAGFGLRGAFSWDLGYLLPMFDFGWSWNPLNAPGSANDDRTLTRFHMGLGLQSEFKNRSIVTPVLGATLDFNWWHISGDTEVACTTYYYWACYAYNVWDYTTGFSFKAGADVHLPRNPNFSLGAGIVPSVTLSGGPFRDAEWWISPYLAFAFRI